MSVALFVQIETKPGSRDAYVARVSEHRKNVLSKEAWCQRFDVMIPKDSENLLVAGRCVGSDRLANSALRVQASSMAMGQAAGAAAAISVRSEASPGDIETAELRALLSQHGAIVPENNKDREVNQDRE